MSEGKGNFFGHRPSAEHPKPTRPLCKAGPADAAPRAAANWDLSPSVTALALPAYPARIYQTKPVTRALSFDPERVAECPGCFCHSPVLVLTASTSEVVFEFESEI